MLHTARFTAQPPVEPLILWALATSAECTKSAETDTSRIPLQLNLQRLPTSVADLVFDNHNADDYSSVDTSEADSTLRSSSERPEMLLKHSGPASYMGLRRSGTNGYAIY